MASQCCVKFLLYNKMKLLSVCVLPLPLRPRSSPVPSHTSRSSQSTELNLPMLHSNFPLAICFTYGNAYVSRLLSQLVLPSPSPAVFLYFSSNFGQILQRIMKSFFVLILLDICLGKQDYFSIANSVFRLSFTSTVSGFPTCQCKHFLKWFISYTTSYVSWHFTMSMNVKSFLITD